MKFMVCGLVGDYTNEPPDVFSGKGDPFPKAHVEHFLNPEEFDEECDNPREWTASGRNHRNEDGAELRDVEVNAWFVELTDDQFTAFVQLKTKQDVRVGVEWYVPSGSLAITLHGWYAVDSLGLAGGW